MPANSILIVGESGSGKSTSMETLNPEQTFVINVSSKPLPFQGWKKKYTAFTSANPKGNLLNTDNADIIVSTLKYISETKPEIKFVIVDDSQYVAANEYMKRVKEVGFQKFTEIALNIFKMPKVCQELRDDLFVFFLSHAETIADAEGNQRNKAKTLGKMIDNTITYEGLFSIVLFTERREGKTGIEYGFVTNGDPKSTAKSPKGMFSKSFIPNDLAVVVDAIRKYEEG